MKGEDVAGWFEFGDGYDADLYHFLIYFDKFRVIYMACR